MLENALHINIRYPREGSGKLSKVNHLILQDIRILHTGEKPESFFPNLLTNYVVNKGDKFYFLEKVSIPRVKLKEFNEQNGTKTVRDLESATHIFASKDTIKLYTQHEWSYTISTELFKFFFDLYKDYFDKKEQEDIRQVLEFYPHDLLFCDYTSMKLLQDTGLPNYATFAAHKDFGSIANSSHNYIISSEYLYIYNSIKNKVLYDESCLISLLNGTTAAIIDENLFGSLCTMLDSSDTDNHVLAMEIMANSQYEKSLLYLLILFYEYRNIMYNLPSKRHVNFKSLLSYLNSDGYMHFNLDKIVELLKDKGVLTTDMLDVLLYRYHKEITDTGSTAIFKVKNITVDPEILAFMNKPYQFNLEEDYVPTVEEVIPEDFLTYIPTVEEETFTELNEEPSDDYYKEIAEEELPGTVSEEENIEAPIVEPKKEEDESSIDWF